MSSVTQVCVTPSHVDLKLVKGTDTELLFTITDDDGRPFNITDDVVDFVVRDSANNIVFSKQNGVGFHLDPQDGTTVFKVVKADLASASDSERTCWYYKITRTRPDSDVFLHIVGLFIVIP